jgi:hypothetical protein
MAVALHYYLRFALTSSFLGLINHFTCIHLLAFSVWSFGIFYLLAYFKEKLINLDHIAHIFQQLVLILSNATAKKTVQYITKERQQQKHSIYTITQISILNKISVR